MDEVWNGRITLDYERTRPNATPLEWELYTSSVVSWPLVLMGEPTPYGTLRRPGIVDVPDTLHQDLVSAWHTRLTCHSYVEQLIETTAAARARTHEALTHLEGALQRADQAAASAALASATGHLLAVMSTHIVNWLLPEAAWQDTLTGLLGHPDAAKACLSALMTPSQPGRLLQAHLTPAIAASAGSTKGLATDTDAARARDRALQLADAWTTAVHLAAAGDDDAMARIRVLTALARWAADSEERRAELRDRYLGAIPLWRRLAGASLDVDDTQLTIAYVTRTGACR